MFLSGRFLINSHLPRGLKGSRGFSPSPRSHSRLPALSQGHPGPLMLSTGRALLFSGVPPPSLNWRAWESDLGSVGSAGPGACVGPGECACSGEQGLGPFTRSERRHPLTSQESLKERGLLPGVSIHQSASWSAPVGHKAELPFPGTLNLHYKVSQTEKDKRVTRP